jgi:hypothetical protein
MKKLLSSIMILGFLGFSGVTYAVDSKTQPSAIQQEYDKHLNSGKSYPDAFAELQFEIAYEMAAAESYKPCKKMVRGL